MGSLNALTGLTQAGATLKYSSPDATNKEAVPTDIQPPPDSVSATSPQVVPAMADTAKTGSGQHHGDSPNNRDDVEGAVNEINGFFQSMQRTLQFTLDEESEQMVIQIKDADGKVLRQIPSEDVLELARRLDEFKGLLFKEKA